jgi:formate dehydrogenase alpha subunit
VAGLATTLGSGAMTNSIGDACTGDVILVAGSNTTEAHPVIGLEMKAAVRKRGAKLILVDPREIELAKYATLHLRHRPGTDTAVFNAMARVILDEGLENRSFIEERTENLDALREALGAFTPEWAEVVSGVPAEEIRAAARLYAGAQAASIFWAMGITQSTHGVDNVFSLSNLALLTGNLGRPGTGLNPLRGQNNVQGACDMGGLPNVYTGYQSVADGTVREKFAAAWGAENLPIAPGLTVTEIIEGAVQGKIRALYIMGENPLLTDPNLHHVRRALENLELLVVQDIFLNETGQHAHVVLPGASFAEKGGTFTNTERRVQLVRPAISPLGGARPDWVILCEIGERLAHAMGAVAKPATNPTVRTVTDWRYTSPAQVWSEIAAMTPSMAGISHARLERGSLQWPCPTQDHPGTPILHTAKIARGKGRFMPVTYRASAEEVDGEYPLILTTGRILFQWHGGTMSRRSAGLETLAPAAEIEVNPVDADRYGVRDAALVEVASRRGKIQATTRVTERSPRGTVFATFHYAEAAANLLTLDAVDPVAKIPEYKVSAVRLRPVPAKRSTRPR